MRLLTAWLGREGQLTAVVFRRFITISSAYFSLRTSAMVQLLKRTSVRSDRPCSWKWRRVHSRAQIWSEENYAESLQPLSKMVKHFGLCMCPTVRRLVALLYWSGAWCETQSTLECVTQCTWRISDNNTSKALHELEGAISLIIRYMGIARIYILIIICVWTRCRDGVV